MHRSRRTFSRLQRQRFQWLKNSRRFAIVLLLLGLWSTVRVQLTPPTTEVAVLEGSRRGVSLTDSTTCTSAAQPTQRLTAATLPFVNTSQALPSASFSELQQTQCEFVNGPLWRHFPHTMQQLLFCWSFWQTTGQVNKPVLVDRKGPIETFKTYRRQGTTSFVPGFRKALKEVFGVQIKRFSWKKTINPVALLEPPNNDLYIIDSDAHMQKLRDGIARHYFPTNNNQADVQSCPAQPRIGILDRQKTRKLVNLPEIQNTIRKVLGQESNPGYDIGVEYFEGKTFLDQVKFFSAHDIVISGHGAQLTGVPFMPDCGGVLEFFPPNYLVPKFFGSLALLSGKHHAFVYLNDSPEDHRGTTREERAETRAVDLCPPADSVQDGLEQLIGDWKKCCQQE